jgi:hypothetical protein
MKIINKTNITSTKGVTLISDIRARLNRPPDRENLSFLGSMAPT